jgi:hypothetical protein
VLGITKEVFQVGPGGPAELIQKGSGDVIILSHLGHLAIDALIDPNVFDNVDTGLRISIVASGQLHGATSGGWWLVTNHHDSGLYRHPTIARGCAQTVNWTMKGAELSETEYSELASLTDRLEVLHADRMAVLATLAQCRGTTLDEVMQQLGIHFPDHD